MESLDAPPFFVKSPFGRIFKLQMLCYRAIVYPTFSLGLKVMSFFYPKVSLGLKERRGILLKLRKMKASLDIQLRNTACIYAHVSSVGEYLQVLPVLEKLKNENQELKIALSYFSPSLSLFMKNREHSIDLLFPYPGDSYFCVRELLQILKPKALLFCKFDLWPELIVQAYLKKVPLYLVSATLRDTSKREKSYLRVFYTSLYQCFEQIFAVSKNDAERFKGFNRERLLDNVCVSGDTRVDSVWERTQKESQKISPDWRNVLKLKAPILVIGSSWPTDEQMIIEALKTLPESHSSPKPFLIWAPHETSEKHSALLQERLASIGYNSTLLSSLVKNGSSVLESTQCLLVDQMGYLVALYSLGNFAYIGAGPGGLHNILEPIGAGLNCFFGPRFSNSPEAEFLISQKAVFSCESAEELSRHFSAYLGHFFNPTLSLDNLYAKALLRSQKYLESQRGAARYCADVIAKGLAK